MGLLYISAHEQALQSVILTEHQSHFLTGKIGLVMQRHRGGIIYSRLNADMTTSNFRTRFKISFLIKGLSAPNEK